MEEDLVPMIRECLGELAECVSNLVPPIKFTADVAKIVLSLPDKILWRKIDVFLQEVPLKNQQQFVRSFNSDLALQKRTVEHLIFILDKMDDIEKAPMLAKMFCAHVESKIPLETFKRLASSINAAFIEDLRHVAFSIPSIQEPFWGSLLRAGLTEVVSAPSPDEAGTFLVQTKYRLNLLGKIFQQIMQDQPITG